MDLKTEKKIKTEKKTKGYIWQLIMPYYIKVFGLQRQKNIPAAINNYRKHYPAQLGR